MFTAEFYAELSKASNPGAWSPIVATAATVAMTAGPEKTACHPFLTVNSGYSGGLADTG